MQTDLRYPGLQYQPDPMQGRIRGSIRKFLRAQFGSPSGFWGNIVGQIMARSSSNQDRLRWTLSLLHLQPTDRVLEIGFGPGMAINLASKIATDGFVAGVDHSEVMVRQATGRNAKGIQSKKVALHLGSASNLPTFAEPFDKIFTINSIHFWNNPVDCLKSLRELLKPGGVIAVTMQPRSRSATDATTRTIGAEIVADLERAGFSNCRLEIKMTKPVSIACALASK